MVQPVSCSQPTSNSVLYTPLAPFATVPKSSKMVLTEDWESQKCANVCKIGFFDSCFIFGYYDKFKVSDLFTGVLDGEFRTGISSLRWSIKSR